MPAFHALQMNVLTKTKMRQASGVRLKMFFEDLCSFHRFPCFSPQDLRLEQVEVLGCQEALVVAMGLGNIL